MLGGMPWRRDPADACPSRGINGQEGGGKKQERCRGRARQPAAEIDRSKKVASAIEHHDQAERPRDHERATRSSLHKRSEERENHD